jgi:RND family efflux transporter MFP subunit
LEARPLPRRIAPALLIALSLLSCQRSDAAKSGADEVASKGGLRAREIPRVRVEPVERRAMVRMLETTSVLESEREVQVLPRASGVVLEIKVEEGDVVEAGEILGILEDIDQALELRDASVALRERQNSLDTLRLAIREAEARVERTKLAAEQARRDHERSQLLFEGETVSSSLSRSALEASKLAQENAEADQHDADLAVERARLDLAAGTTAVERADLTLERARTALEHTRIVAPFAGVVAERLIRPGDSVGPSEPAFVLTDLVTLRAVFWRPQEELELFARARAGDGATRLEISATAEAYPGTTFSGQVERVSPTIDPDSGQFRVTARLAANGAGSRLLPGMLVRMQIATDRHEGTLVVRKRALRRESDRRFLLVVENGTLRRVDVEEGFSDTESVEVVPLPGSTLAEGEIVVLVGGRELAAGDTVEIDATRSESADGEGSAPGGESSAPDGESSAPEAEAQEPESR